MFDLDVYICLICFYPIIFRYDPPQIYHLPTGWDCWRKQKQLEGEGIELLGDAGVARCRIPETTLFEVREKLHERAKTRFGIFCRSGNAAPLLDFVMTQLERDRGDVVRDLFAYLAITGSAPAHEMVHIVVSLSNWQEYAVRLRAQELKKHRDRLGSERQRLARRKGGR